MPKVALDEKFIRSLDVVPGMKRTEWCDTTLPGLFVEARATSPGKGTFYLRYKNTQKKTAYTKLGNTEEISVKEARSRASQLKAELALSVGRSKQLMGDSSGITLSEFSEQQYLPYAKAKKRSWKDDENRLKQRILPLFGERAMSSIKRAELVQFHLSLKAEGLSGATCDHFLKLMRRIYNLAIEWEALSTNPLEKIKLFNEPNQVENLLSDEELYRLMTTLYTYPNQRLCRIARFLLATGARMNEALQAEWSNINIEKRLWLIPALQSKSKKVISKPLNDAAIRVLQEIQPDEQLRSGYLFANPATGKPLTSIHKGWKAIREAAGLPHLRIHDLRHQYASMLVNSGRSLYEVQQLLGHSSPQVTQRYAHLSTATLQDAANAASAQLEAASPKLLPSPADSPDEAA
jgi:integrase